jgi:hypothetical protein
MRNVSVSVAALSFAWSSGLNAASLVRSTIASSSSSGRAMDGGGAGRGPVFWRR